ncbi:MAG: SGNH/GDSL hydrolase family protein, partial [Myxococcota bacterium]|nr:SGNH/GDSL hydrolase family protein [Myxococcota bacterium]
GEGTAITAHVHADAQVSLGPDGTLTVASGGGEWSCPGPGRADGPAALQAGLRRVMLPLISIDGLREPPPLSPLVRIACAIGGSLALVLLVGLETRLGMSWIGAAAGWLPLLLSAVLAARDLSSLHDLLRMPSLPIQALPLGAGVGIALGGKILLHAIRLSRRGPMGWLGAVGLGGLLGAVPGLLAAAPAMAVGLFTLTGGILAALGAVQGHARTMRGYNRVSLLLAVCGLLGLEAAIRQTSVGDFWNGQDRSRGAGTATTLASEFEALAAAEPTTYPSEGYPVLAPPKAAPLRIVCLGGSSTGGAFQNDDLADFYPARLAERLGAGIEVINQGTGGWNSLHIALFAEQSLARLQPDIVTVYAGVNDQVEAPIQYRALHSAWASGALKPGVTGFLDSIRLFQGLRYSIRGLRGSVIAVPPEHTADNLRRVARAARDVGARTLLLSEAVQPRPEAFAPYWRAMGAVAAEHPDTAFVHTAEHLRGLGPRGFLDQNHLSELGHGKLAERLEAALRGHGWLPTHGAPPGGAALPPGR